MTEALKGVEHLLRHHSYCDVFDERACNCSIREAKAALEEFEK